MITNIMKEDREIKKRKKNYEKKKKAKNQNAFRQVEKEGKAESEL